MLAELVVKLAGRAAEEMLLDGDYTSGASGDIASATGMAQSMVKHWGMSDLGLAAVGHDAVGLGARIHAETDRFLSEALEHARTLLAEHQPLVEAVAHELLAEETIDLVRIRQLLAAVEGAPVG
jgi:ATP-dependent Zn protease